jgi:hypothetical protein
MPSGEKSPALDRIFLRLASRPHAALANLIDIEKIGPLGRQLTPGYPGEPASLKGTDMTRHASCGCGQLRLVCEGEPVRISMCHCLECQRRTGSVFGVQARFRREQVTVQGRSKQFSRAADSGNSVTFHFCPDCGATVYWALSGIPGVVAVAVGAFADPGFPEPRHSVYESRRHSWSMAPADLVLEHLD